MKFPILSLALLGWLFAHTTLARISYAVTITEEPEFSNNWCMYLVIVDDAFGSDKISVAGANCDWFTYPGENQLAWDFAGSYDHYYAKIKAKHLWLILGLGVTYGTDHGTFYFDIELTKNENGSFFGQGEALG